MMAIAGVAFVAGAIVGAGHGSSSARDLAGRFTAAWARGDYATMYSVLDPASQQAIGVTNFANDYVADDATATAESFEVAGRPRELTGGAVRVPVRVRTRLFGTLNESFTLPISNQGGTPHVVWSRHLAFPGVLGGERLTRHTTLPPRATLLARDGSVLASGPAPPGGGQRNSPFGPAVDAVLGSLGPIPSERSMELEAQGVPPDALVGTSGLEGALDQQLRGKPGGVLLAGQRVLATATAQAAPAVRTTVSPTLQQAAVAGLGGLLGGIVIMRPSTGEILAVAGLGIDDTQPPGSTFKMITLTGVLENGIARPSSTFPFQTYATLDGVQLQNANGELCGGTLTEAFAVSCNSVFAPLGAKLGAQRLVATAESFGFNQPPEIPGAAESTIPPASHIQGDLSVGSSAIGQDAVSASVLEMTQVAATIADGGRRPHATFLLGQPPTGARVTSPSVARTVRRLMIGVVDNGTGTAAQIPGVVVAGKTGTAELTSTGSSNDPGNTDAWFAAFAPALHPRIAVGVMLVRDGAGGATAAPIAHDLLVTALHTKLG